jgi:hypothetical protein
MVTYKILDVNIAERWARIRYSRDGETDFFIQTILGDDDFDEAALHAEAAEEAQQAIAWWTAQAEAEPVVLESDTGVIGNITVEAFPEYDPMVEDCQIVKTVTGDNIAYTYVVAPLPADTVGNNVRGQRDDLLHHTDMHALSDRVLSTAMQTYRQALRDITDQEGFPLSVVWPSEPID